MVRPIPLVVLVLVAEAGCGTGARSATEDASPSGVDAAAPAPPCPAPGAATTSCPNDPAPCPGACNPKGYCELDCSTGPEIRIPAGTVVMGGDQELDAPYVEKKRRLATVTRPFYIDRFETPVSKYRTCIEAGACTEPRAPVFNEFASCTYYLDQTRFPQFAEMGLLGERPVNCATWYQADEYCRWKGGRLPTSAEWMLAGRGPASTRPGSCEREEDLVATDDRCNMRRFTWGDSALPEDTHRANVGAGDISIPEADWRFSFHAPTPIGFFDGSTHVGTKTSYTTFEGSSMYGVHDLVGNLSEWVSHVVDWNYEASAPRNDPTGPERTNEFQNAQLNGSTYSTAGSAFYGLPQRRGVFPKDASAVDGFRCARDAQ